MNLKKASRTVKSRGGAIRYRTIVPEPGKYIHIAITRKVGPQGGRTVAGPVRTVKRMHPKVRKALGRRR
jgi:hypothetical protein